MTNRDRLIQCFQAVFPHLTVEEIVVATHREIKGWDSVASINLLMEVELEFNRSFELNVLNLKMLSSFPLILAYLDGEVGVKKGLITDLDETLWSGYAGTDKVKFNRNYSGFLYTISKAGVLIGAATRNDEQVLPYLPSHIFPVEFVGVGDKSDAIKSILSIWNIFPDSVVFVDDNPMELAEVKSAIPEIECVLAGPDVVERLRPLFNSEPTTPEDSIRLASIKSGVDFQRDYAAAGSPEEFLARIGAELTYDQADPADPRPLELVNKANQFHLNGRRFTQAEWAEYNRTHTVIVVSYTDRYGPLGKVAVVGVGADIKVCDLMVLSCRAFGRDIEYQIGEKLAFTQYRYRPTGKNDAVKRFLEESVVGVAE